TTISRPAIRPAPAMSSNANRPDTVPRKINADRLDVVAKGWRYTSDSTTDATAPVAQMMNIQLETWSRSSPNWPITAICTGSMPTAYQIKVVRPAHAAGAVKSLRSVRRRSGTAPVPRGRLWRPAYGLLGGVAASAVCRGIRGRKARTVAMQGQYRLGLADSLGANELRTPERKQVIRRAQQTRHKACV